MTQSRRKNGKCCASNWIANKLIDPRGWRGWARTRTRAPRSCCRVLGEYEFISFNLRQQQWLLRPASGSLLSALRFLVPGKNKSEIKDAGHISTKRQSRIWLQPGTVYCQCQVGLRGWRWSESCRMGWTRSDWRPCNCIKMQFELPVDRRFRLFPGHSRLPVALFSGSMSALECRCHRHPTCPYLPGAA